MKLIATLLIAASLSATAFSSFAEEAAAAAAKPDLAKGEASFGAVCAACHSPDGNSVIAVNPKLAQQHPEYLVKQLQEFKAGKRANPIMMGMSAALSEADTVSYTHLDVYKRQPINCAAARAWGSSLRLSLIHI